MRCADRATIYFMAPPVGGIDAYEADTERVVESGVQAHQLISLAPQAAPPANPATGAVIFSQLVTGKNKVYALFPTGTVVLLATEV